MTERTEQDIRAELMRIYSGCQAAAVGLPYDSALADLYETVAVRSKRAIRDGTIREIALVLSDFRDLELTHLHMDIAAMLREAGGGGS